MLVFFKRKVIVLDTKQQRNHCRLIASIACLLSFILLVNCFAKPQLESVKMEKSVEQKNGINGRRYADLSNSSKIPFTTQFQGEIVWEDATILKTNPQPAIHLCIIDEALIIYYQDATINVRLKKTGEIKWSRAHSYLNEFQVIENNLTSMQDCGQLQLIDPNQTINNVISVPLFVDSYLHYLEIENKNIHFCINQFPSPVNSPDDPIIGPEFNYIGYNSDEKDIIWNYEKPEALITVLKYFPENRLYLVTDKNIHTSIIDSKDDKKIKTINCSIIKSASLSPDGDLIIVEETKEGLSIKCLSLSNENPLWQYNFKLSSVSLQPPSAITSNDIYFLHNNSLLRLNQSTVKWNLSLPSKPENIKFTVLSDESILISANQILLHISPDGKELSRMILPEQLTCRPIVDGEGNIYVAGSNSVYCIK